MPALNSPVLDLPAFADSKKNTRAEDAVRRLTGVYYTLPVAAEFMANWLVRHEREHILEPSFGDGVFLRAITASSRRQNLEQVRITGIEIDEVAEARTRNSLSEIDASLRCSDFLSVSPFPVQAVIGNPPYVRLRNLPDDQKERGLRTAEAMLGQPMEPSGSVWMPFILHAMRFLTSGGRMALVLPYELTYVRYGRPLWKILGQKFGSLQVLRTHERLFPDILQDVVILLADGYGEHTNAVRYQAFERVEDICENRAVVDEQLPITGLLSGQRLFVEALLKPELRSLLQTRVAEVTTPARNRVTFNIGYVSGDKTFFHPTHQVVRQYGLTESALRSALTSTRSLKGIGLKTSALHQENTDHLFLPPGDVLTPEERHYVTWGEETGVSRRYKCQVRDPWFLVPGIRVPDLVLSVFSERPVLLINDAGHLASNSLLCGFTSGPTSAEIVASWYTSLTLLQCELEVHALGGGVMVLIPGEAGNIRLPRQVSVQEEHLTSLDSHLKRGKTTAAYQSGDCKVLIEQLGFTQEEVNLIRRGVESLAHWRTSSRSSLLTQKHPRTEADC